MSGLSIIRDIEAKCYEYKNSLFSSGPSTNEVCVERDSANTTITGYIVRKNDTYRKNEKTFSVTIPNNISINKYIKDNKPLHYGSDRGEKSIALGFLCVLLGGATFFRSISKIIRTISKPLLSFKNIGYPLLAIGGLVTAISGIPLIKTGWNQHFYAATGTDEEAAALALEKITK